ncbi:MAG: hypothetical protein IPP94_18330 [Ignavibacteria bacterium]|nr:hypothetical protein [Ignavibacteria bacterium]
MNTRNRSPFHAFSMDDIFTDGSPSQTEGSWMERTARELAHRELTELASLPEKSPDPIIEVSSNGHVTFCNAAARRSFPGLIVKSASHTLINHIVPVLDLFAAGKTCEAEREFEIKGRIFHAYLVLNSETKRVRVYLKDVTRIRDTERQLRAMRREVFEQQQRFAALFNRLAHDIRTDLNILVGYSSLVCEEEASFSGGEKHELKEMITNAGFSLEKRLEAFSETITMASAVPPPQGTDEVTSATQLLAPSPLSTLS